MYIILPLGYNTGTLNLAVGSFFMRKKCLFCGNFVRTNQNKYCSSKCFISNRYDQTYRNCIRCNKRFRTYPCEIRTGRGRHCSRFCATEDIKKNTLINPRWKRGICMVCGNSYRIIPNREKRGMSKYCSLICFGKDKRGIRNSPKSEFKRDKLRPLKLMVRDSGKYRAWRRDAYEQGNYICQECGVRGGKLHVDHIKPYSLIFIENNIKTYEQAMNCKELWDYNNTRILCISCHRKTDTWGGKTSRIIALRVEEHTLNISVPNICSNPQ